MSIIHLVVGDMAAAPLNAAIQEQRLPAEELLVLKDILHLGSLRNEENTPFSELRTKFWAEVVPEGQALPEVDDLERLMQASSKLSNDDQMQLWFWMASAPADLCAYFWMLNYLKKHIGRIYVVNIGGLPFLDEDGKLFYPDSISRLPVKEVLKAVALSRQLTPPEWETDGEEWQRLTQENAGIRTFQGGKKLQGEAIDFYDKQLQALCSNAFQKMSRIVNIAIQKQNIPTGDWFLQWRLRCLAEQGLLEIQKSEVKRKADSEEEKDDGAERQRDDTV